MSLHCSFFQLPSPLWQTALALRFEVFVHEQKVPRELEIDAYDRMAHHLLARDEQQNGVGTLRIVVQGEAGKIGRVAVAAPYRRRGTGLRMMRMALEHCRALGLSSVVLDSQTYIIPFYERLGFVREGEIFMDAGIPHIRMRLAL